MSAVALKERLRADLKSAIQAKVVSEVRLLRTLIAALDNAEAVEPSARPPEDAVILERLRQEPVVGERPGGGASQRIEQVNAVIASAELIPMNN